MDEEYNVEEIKNYLKEGLETGDIKEDGFVEKALKFEIYFQEEIADKL